MTEKHLLKIIVNKYVDLSELMFLLKREKEEYVRNMYNFNKHTMRILSEEEYTAIRDYIFRNADDFRVDPSSISCNIKGKES